MKIQVNLLSKSEGHKDCIYSLEKGTDKNLFYSGSADGYLVCWDLQKPNEGKVIAKIPAPIYSLKYLSCQNCLIAGQRNGGLHIIDLNTSKEIHFIQAFSSSIFDIVSGGIEETFYVATGEGSVSLWHFNFFNSIKIQKPTSSSCRTLAFNSDSHEIAAGFSDHKIRVFDSNDLKPKLTLSGHKNSVFTLSYTPDYKYLLSGGRDAQLKIWEVASGYKEVNSIAAHTFAINHIAFRPDGKYFATASMDKNVKIWKTEDFQLVKVINKTKMDFHSSSVNKVLWTDDNKHLITCGDDRVIYILEVLEGEGEEG